jgi:hypothetical protein
MDSAVFPANNLSAREETLPVSVTLHKYVQNRSYWGSRT